MDPNRSKYSDYDSRPIKPLDPNKLKNQLSEYTELTDEELQLLKQRTVQRGRAKTVEPAPKQTRPTGHAPKSPMVRQLSFNSNRSMHSLIGASKKVGHSNAQINSRVIEMKRSKTEEALPQKCVIASFFFNSVTKYITEYFYFTKLHFQLKQ